MFLCRKYHVDVNEKIFIDVKSAKIKMLVYMQYLGGPF